MIQNHAADPRAVAAEEHASFNFSRASAAIIDGSPVSADLLSTILRGFGFRAVYRCLTLAAAADVVKTRSVDLILLDPFSFGASAYDFAKWLRAEERGANADAALLLVSAFTPVRLIARARDCGIDYVVAKPFCVSTLLDRILWVAAAEERRGETSTLMAADAVQARSMTW